MNIKEVNRLKEYGYNTKEIYVQNETNRIYGVMYLPQGDGPFPLIIYSHGYAYNYEEYDLSKLAQHGIAAYRFDFCGGSVHSKSDGESTDMSVLTEASDLEAVLDEMKKLTYIDQNRIYLSGNSQGGFVSTIVGVNRKEDIDGLFLLCPGYVITEFSQMYRKIEGIERFGKMMISEKYVNDGESYDLYNEIKKYDKPVVIYHGTKDGLVPIRYSKKAVKYFPNAKLIELNGAGHSFENKTSTFIVNDIIKRINHN